MSSWPHATQRVTFFHWFRADEILTYCRFLHLEQTTESTGSAAVEISASQEWHLNCIIQSMKPLILLLLFAITVGAQSLPEIARKERERRANLKSTRIMRTETG